MEVAAALQKKKPWSVQHRCVHSSFACSTKFVAKKNILGCRILNGRKKLLVPKEMQLNLKGLV